MEAKEIVKNYLEQQCEQDAVLKERYDEKYIDKCWDYIVNCAKAEAKGSSSVCIEDNQVYQWARHYYLEGLSEKDIDNVKKEADKYYSGEIKKSKYQKELEKKQNKIDTNQISLFDMGV